MRKLSIDINNLLARCNKGNRDAQRQLHQQFYSYGLNVCLRYARNKEEAQEMLNDGFLKVFLFLKKQNFEGVFAPWLKKVLINAAIDHHRKYKKYEPFDDLENSNYLEEGIESSFNFEYDEILWAIQQLTPQYRMVFNLYIMEGYKHHEIATMLNIKIGTSKSNLSKAKAKLQTMLKKEFRQTK